MDQMLNSLSYKSVLARGYAIVRDSNNQIISRTDAGMPATIEFADGVINISWPIYQKCFIVDMYGLQPPIIYCVVRVKT